MDGKKRSPSNNGKRPQSIEKMRRNTQPQSIEKMRRNTQPQGVEKMRKNTQPQSIEKMRRNTQPKSGAKKKKNSQNRRDYSDGYSSREVSLDGQAGNVYDFKTGTKRNKRPASKQTSAQTVKRTKASKTRRPRQNKPVSRAKLRFRRFVLSFLAVSAVVLVGLYLSLTVWFKTENIRIEGETRYSAERILEVCPIEIGENIFLADKRSAAAQIKNALPYIEQAEVKFSIPNTIIINVSDAEAAYQIGADGGYYAISSSGRILEKLDSKMNSVPAVECSGLKDPEIGGYAEFSSDNVPDILADVVKEIRSLKINNITVVDIMNAAQIKLFYDDRILIVIGLPEDINYKLRTAMKIINDKLDPNNSGVISGRLDVSLVNETKKSYFNENEIYVPPSETHPSGPATGSTTEPTGTTETTTGDAGITEMTTEDNGITEATMGDNGITETTIGDVDTTEPVTENTGASETPE